jgi:hypothetical protein
MPTEERRERYEALIQRVRTNNGTRGREAFLEALRSAPSDRAS